MSAVNALAVLDAEIERRGSEPYAQEMIEARAVMAELIEAAQAFPRDPAGVRDWHPSWRDKMTRLINAANRCDGGAA